MANKTLEEQLLITEGADAAVLLFHGFGASPWEMQELAEYLHKEKYTVCNATIAGHETSIENFADTSWEEWHYGAIRAYHEIKRFSSKTYVIGFSMGGALALLLSQHERPQGIVSLNAPVWLRSKAAGLAKVLKHFKKSIAVELTEEEKGHYYEQRPLKAVEQLVDFMEIYQKNLKKIKSPLLVIQSSKDPTVDPKSAYHIFERAGSTDKRIHLYDSADHVITRGKHKDAVFPRILEFLRSH